MSSNRRLIEQFVSLWFCVNNLTEASDEAAGDAAHAVYVAAAEGIEAGYRKLPCQREPAQDFEIETFAVCAPDWSAEVRDGVIAYSTTIWAERAIPLAVAKEFKDFALAEFTRAAAAQGATVRLVEATRQYVWRVTEEATFKFED